jgi:6-phosphogluconolactonase
MKDSTMPAGRLVSLCLGLVLALAVNFSISSSNGEEPDTKSHGPYRVYIGTYTGGQSKGIYVCEFDAGTGKLSEPRLAAAAVNPSFLALHPQGKFLYAVSEIADFSGEKTGAVAAYSIAPSGDLKLLNQQSCGGGGPCHLVVDSSGGSVLVANYGGGSVAALPIGNDGRLGKAKSVIQHQGSSVNKSRQSEPHAHSINLDPASHFAFAADLGMDKVLVYRFDAKLGTLEANDPPSAPVAPGSGPRHFAFHPSGKYAYVINELANTVTAFSYNAHHGALKEIQTITTLPEDFKGTSYTAEVVVHPSGKFLYGSNRGHDSLAIFTVDQETGKLSAAGHASTGGKTPRNFNIDPTGHYVLAANQDAGTIVVLRVDQHNGALTPRGQTVKVGMPVCVKFLKL